MDFDLQGLLVSRSGDGPVLWDRYLNPHMHATTRVMGIDRTWERASGAWVYDSDGNRYLDLIEGFGAFGVGHNHPVVRQAIHDALDLELADMMQLDTPLLPGLLAEKLLEKAPGLERVYFCNSGTEAVEAALKFARCATGRDRFVYCRRGFHGLTLGALSVNGDPAFTGGFGHLLPSAGIPFGDLDALEAELRKGGVAAFIAEPVQGHGTCVAPDGFLTAAAALCHEHGALLICDEVQTGLGRTGRWFGYQHEPGFVPDIITVAKALSGGYVPVGAVLTRDWIARRMWRSASDALRQSTTFMGGAAATAAGLAMIAVAEAEDLVANAEAAGDMMLKALTAMEWEMIGEVRGRGLMIGVEFREPQRASLRAGYKVLHKMGAEVPALCAAALMFRRGAWATVAAAGMPVLRMTPPLTLTRTEAQTGLDAFAGAMAEMHGRGAMARFAWQLTGRGVAARFAPAGRRGS